MSTIKAWHVAIMILGLMFWIVYVPNVIQWEQHGCKEKNAFVLAAVKGEPEWYEWCAGWESK